MNAYLPTVPRKSRTNGSLHDQAKKAIKALITTLTIMIVGLSIAFLATTNESAQKGYALEQEKLKNEELKTINSNLTSKITQATASDKITENEKIKEMKEAEKKSYVTPEDNDVK